MVEVDVIQLAVFGFFTGLGTTFGTETAKTLFEYLRKRRK
jgi:hypothetical protein